MEGTGKEAATVEHSVSWNSVRLALFFLALKIYSRIYLKVFVESSWNVMAHGDAREGTWRGNWRMEWVASTLHTTSEHGVCSITTADAHTSAASSRLNWRPHAYLNGLVRFAERRNLVSTRVPSHFKRSLIKTQCTCTTSFTEVKPPLCQTEHHTINTCGEKRYCCTPS